MIVTTHQADLLPYSGFWFKMAKADLFDLKIYDQFQARGYQRRVAMRGSWASVPVIGSPSRARICDVRIRPDEAATVLKDQIAGRYRGSRNWDTVGKVLTDMIDDIRTEHLWQFNLSLILGVRDLLGITTPISIALPPEGRGSVGLVSVLRRYNADAYLAGQGGRAYMGDCAEFTEAGIEVQWSAHRPVTGDSIVTVLMDYDDPMSVVLAE
ncbi:MAG TPA: WbqC family protein [Microlunatus sp.]|nr:WbqC family protein [Microlunatus sp.]